MTSELPRSNSAIPATRAWLARLMVVTLALFLAGCVETELKVTNHTGDDIQFTTGHTLKTYAIRSGATVVVPHTVGTVSITTTHHRVWNYDVIRVPDLQSEVKHGYQRLTLPVSVEADGAIVLPSGRKLRAN
jgi:hypothetical protein